jgi:hypothetical protein
MSFHVAIASAPIRQGTAAAPSAWSGASTTTPTFSGIYDGSVTRTLTFTVITAGTIGTTGVIEVDWDDAIGSTGRLQLGADEAAYVAGEDVYVDHGVSVAFSAGAFSAADTFTVVFTAANRLSGSPVVVSGDANPTDVQVVDHELGDIDIANLSFDGRETRVQRSTTGVVRLFTDYLDDENMDKLRYLHSSRSPVCIGENYDESTVFLMHGGGLLPMIGQAATFSRAGNATYTDPRTGLLRSVSANVPRIVGGQAGRAILQELDATNLFTQSSGKSGAPYWNVTGGTITFDTTIKGPFEPSDPYWDPDFTAGTNRANFTASGDRIDTPDIVVTAAVAYAGSVWLRGRGEVTFELRTGIGSATTVLTSQVIDLGTGWVRYSLTGTVPGGHNRADLRVVASEKGVCYFWGWQLEQARLSSLIQTDGGTASRTADSLTCQGPIPVSQGMMSLWFMWPAYTIHSTYSIFTATGVSGSEAFRLDYGHNTPTYVSQYVSTTGSTFYFGQFAEFTTDSWHHYVTTWKKSATAGSLDVAQYIDGVSMGSPTAISAWQPFFGTGFVFYAGLPIEEVRIDRSWKSDAEVAELYDRLTDEAWLHLHRAHAGRKYRIVSMRPSWLHTSQPDKIVMEVTLQEMDREDDSVVVTA